MKKLIFAFWSVVQALLPFFHNSILSHEDNGKKLVEPGITIENGSIQAEIEEEDFNGKKRKRKTSISGTKVYLTPEQTNLISLPPGDNKSQ